MRFSGQQQIDDLIKRIYKVKEKSNSMSINSILYQMGEILNCETVGIFSEDPISKKPILNHVYGTPKQQVDYYNEYYNQLDPTFNVLSCRHLKSIPDHVTSRNAPVGNNKWKEFSHDFLKPLNYDYSIGINILSSVDNISRSLICARNYKEGPFSEREINFVNSMGFHISDVYAFVADNSSLNKVVKVHPDDFIRMFRCTQRQAEIAHSVCTRSSTLREIAEDFGVSEKTIKSHLTPVYEAAGVRRLGLTAMMLEFYENN